MEAEYNIAADVSGARTLFGECPVPVAVAHYLVGRSILTVGILIEKDRKNPVAESYFVHSHGNREIWDLVAAYYAVFGADEIFFLGKRGTVKIDERGVSRFEEDVSGKHFLIACNDPVRAEERLDDILSAGSKNALKKHLARF